MREFHKILLWHTADGKPRLTGHGIAWRLRGRDMVACVENHWNLPENAVDISDPDSNWYSAVCPDCGGDLGATCIEVMRRSKRYRVPTQTQRMAEINQRGPWAALNL